VSKKLQEKQRKRLAEEKRRAEMKRAARRRNLITLVLAIVVTGGVVWLILDESGGGDSKGSTADYGVSTDEAGCGSVESPELQKADHIEVGTDHAPYSSSPPTSGPHYAAPVAPIDTGFYTDDIEPEKVVHNLEHGMIVIWYKPDAPQQTIDAVEDAVNEQPDATVAVPWSDMSDDVALTAWGKLQSCANVSKEVVDDFRVEFQGKGPEMVGIPQFTKPD
jgi:uncharacterized protein DUF3105